MARYNILMDEIVSKLISFRDMEKTECDKVDDDGDAAAYEEERR